MKLGRGRLEVARSRSFERALVALVVCAVGAGCRPAGEARPAPASTGSGATPPNTRVETATNAPPAPLPVTVAPAVARSRVPNELALCAVERPELKRVVLTLNSPPALRPEWRLLVAAWLEENVAELRPFRTQTGFDVAWLVPEARAASVHASVAAFFRAPAPSSFFRAKTATTALLEQLESRGAPSDAALALAPLVDGPLVTATARLRTLDEATARSALELTRREGELRFVGPGVLGVATAAPAAAGPSVAAPVTAGPVAAGPVGSKNLGVLATSFTGASATAPPAPSATTSSAAPVEVKSRLVVVPSDTAEWVRLVAVAQPSARRSAVELDVVTTRSLATTAVPSVRVGVERGVVVWAGPAEAVAASANEWLAQLDALATRPITDEERAAATFAARTARWDGGACDDTSGASPPSPQQQSSQQQSVSAAGASHGGLSRVELSFVAFGNEAVVKAQFEPKFELRVLPAPRPAAAATPSEAAPSQ